VQKYEPVIVTHVFGAHVAPKATWQTALDPNEVVAAVTGGGAALGVVMRPLSVDLVIRADEAGALLPFGSTAVHPQVARLITYIVDQDEDLV